MCATSNFINKFYDSLFDVAIISVYTLRYVLTHREERQVVLKTIEIHEIGKNIR